MNQQTILPIFQNHQHEFGNVIGTVTAENGKLTVRMRHGCELPEKEIFDTFGNISFRVLEMIEVKYTEQKKYRVFEIISYGWRPLPAMEPQASIAPLAARKSRGKRLVEAVKKLFSCGY